MKTRALILCCLLTVPAVRAQQGTDASTVDDDPFGFLKDDSNTVYTKPPPSTPAATAKPTPAQSVPTVTDSKGEDPFEFLLDDSNTVFTGATPGSKIPPGKGEIRFGLQYVTDDNFTLGRYNGLDEEGFVPILDIDYGSWQQDPDSGEQPLFWSARLQDGFTDVQAAVVHEVEHKPIAQGLRIVFNVTGGQKSTKFSMGNDAVARLGEILVR